MNKMQRNITIKEENRMSEVKKNTFNIMFNANGTFNNILLTTIPNSVKKNITNSYIHSLFKCNDTLSRHIGTRDIFEE